MIGGVTVDHDGRTTLPGLWAAGEVTSSGLHGANRLASNSLLEGLVYGARAAEDIRRSLEPSRRRPPGGPADRRPSAGRERHEPLDLADIRDSLRALMWRSVGITRDARGLAEAAEQVDFWCRYVLGQVFDDPAGWTLQNMLTVARLMIAAAAAREESRGVHSRRDFPDTDPGWAHHITLVSPPEGGPERDVRRAGSQSSDDEDPHRPGLRRGGLPFYTSESRRNADPTRTGGSSQRFLGMTRGTYPATVLGPEVEDAPQLLGDERARRRPGVGP